MIHKELRVAMIRADLNQDNVAEACGVTQGHVSNILHGMKWQGSDGRKIMNYICEQTGKPMAELFPWELRRSSDQTAA